MRTKFNHPLPLTLIATTLISGVAFAIAWTGPTTNPYGNNADVPINAGSVDQTKTGALSANGFVSSGGLRVSGNANIGSLTTPRSALEVNGNIGTKSLYDSGAGYQWASIGGTSIMARDTIYSYGYICTGNNSGNCDSTGGVVLGPANTSANVNITNSGNSFFNVGNVGIGTNSPTAKLQVNVASASTDGALIYANDARSIRLAPSQQSGNYNPITQLGDQSIIFSGGSIGTGSLVIAPWSNTLSGIRIASSGNVGIGTSTPSQKLSVAGTIQSSSGGYVFPDGTTQTTAATGQWTTAGSDIYNANTGNVGIGGVPSGSKLHVQAASNPQIQLRSQATGLRGLWTTVDDTNGVISFNSSYNNTGAYPLTFQIAGTEAMRVDASRNVGIGAAAPSYAKLYVSGDTVMAGAAGTSYFSSGAANYIRGNTYFNGALSDENDGAFYLDPNNTSIFNAVNIGKGAAGVPTLSLNNNITSSQIFNYIDGTLYIGAGATGATRHNINLYNLNCNNSTCNVPAINLYADNTAVFGSATVAGNLTFGADRSGIVGSYNPAQTRPIYAMGSSYILPTGGASNNYGSFYGLAMSYDPDYGAAGNNPQSKAGLGHQVLLMANGITQTALGTGIWSNGVIQSASGGFKFPDGTTQTTAYTGGGSFIQNQVAAAQSASAWVSGTITANSGVRGIGGGGDSWLQFSNGNNYLRGNTYANGTYYDEQNSGYYMDLNNTTRINGVNADSVLAYGSININNASPTYYFQDTDGKTAMLHNNSNQFYILSGCGASNSTSWCQNGSYWPLQIDLTNDNMTIGGSVNIPEGSLTVSSGSNLYGGAAVYGIPANGNALHISRDSTSPFGSDATLSLAEATNSTGRTAKIQFHDSGVSEGYIELANGGTRRLRFADNQGSLMGIETTGNVGIRTAPGGHALDVNGDTWTNGWFRTNGNTGWYSESWGGGWFMQDSTWIRSYGSKNVYIDASFDTGGAAGVGCGGGVGGGYQFRVCGAAGVGAAAYYYTSDARLKENLVPLQDSLSKVRELQGYTFNWKEGGRADVGVVAQEVEKVFPQLVKTDAKGYKSVEYGNLVAPLIEAVKELANKFDALATRIFNIENRLTNLEKQNESQAQQIQNLQNQINELKAKK